MEVIKCIRLEKEFAGRSLFTIQQLSLQAGQKVGLVGNNGVGKSTFLKILLGLDRDFAGQVEVKADWAYVPQLQERSSLSGGERVRLSLAKVLLTDANLLILDEPTNFLDLTAIEALERFLTEYQGSVLVISHDQDFVDKVARSKWWIKAGSLID